MVAVVLSSLVLHGSGAQDPVIGPPSPLPGLQAPLPDAPSLIAWTVDLPAPPTTSPLLTTDLVIAAYLPGVVAAYHRVDGRLAWRVELETEGPLAADGPLLYVPVGDTLHALTLTDGSPAWTVSIGTQAAPLVAKDGWLLTVDGRALSARRAIDGVPIWTVDAGPQREASVIAGDMLVTPVADGRLVARDLLTGAVRWERPLGGAPGPVAVIGDDVLAGASDQRFYCVDAANGRIEWHQRVGATIRGRASADSERIFYAALDNQVHAVDRWDGARRWQAPLNFRPLTGAIAAGARVFVGAPGAGIRILDAASGRVVGSITVGDQLALEPAFLADDGLAAFAAVTGSLGEIWRLSATRDIPVATVPASR
jgi:outer membrane protein assembly factor BamB